MESTNLTPDLEFRPATTELELRAVYPVMTVLRPQYSLDEFVQFVQDLLIPSGARVIAGYHGGVVVCVGVFKIGHSLAWGKHLYIDDLVTAEKSRSLGCGSALLRHIAAIGMAEGCRELHLDSGVQRHEAHRFYLRERMDIVFYHFRSQLA